MLAHAGVAAFHLAFADWVSGRSSSFRSGITENLAALFHPETGTTA